VVGLFAVKSRGGRMALGFCFVLVGMALFGARAGAQQVTKQDVPGAVNFTRLETTVACGGATKPEAVPEIKKLGFASIINLRLPTEAGADVDAEAAAAQTTGTPVYQIPVNAQQPHTP